MSIVLTWQLFAVVIRMKRRPAICGIAQNFISSDRIEGENMAVGKIVIGIEASYSMCSKFADRSRFAYAVDSAKALSSDDTLVFCFNHDWFVPEDISSVKLEGSGFLRAALIALIEMKGITHDFEKAVIFSDGVGEIEAPLKEAEVLRDLGIKVDIVDMGKRDRNILESIASLTGGKVIQPASDETRNEEPEQSASLIPSDVDEAVIRIDSPEKEEKVEDRSLKAFLKSLKDKIW